MVARSEDEESHRVREGAGVCCCAFVSQKKNLSDEHALILEILGSLDIPANNCAILQRGDDLELLPAGQHYITNPNVTLRGLFTLGENQLEMPTKDMCVCSSGLTVMTAS
jgi:hypothetical protein